jgi:hypothetical protein
VGTHFFAQKGEWLGSYEKQIPMTDEQRANWLARKDAQQAEIELTAAKTRQFSKFLRTDPLVAVQELGLLKGN